MADTTGNAVRAAIKALDEVIAPALDPAQPLAAEQLRLVRGLLDFLGARVALLHERHRFELEHYAALAQQLAADAAQVSGEAAATLAAALAGAAPVRADPLASNDAMAAATAPLAAAASALVREAAGAEPALRRRIEQAVIRGARPWVDVQRAWFAPRGFELEPDTLPPLADALAVR